MPIVYRPTPTKLNSRKTPYNVASGNFKPAPPQLRRQRGYNGRQGLTPPEGAIRIQKKVRQKLAAKRTQKSRLAREASNRVRTKAVGLPNNLFSMSVPVRPGQKTPRLKPLYSETPRSLQHSRSVLSLNLPPHLQAKILKHLK